MIQHHTDEKCQLAKVCRLCMGIGFRRGNWFSLSGVYLQGCLWKGFLSQWDRQRKKKIQMHFKSTAHTSPKYPLLYKIGQRVNERAVAETRWRLRKLKNCKRAMKQNDMTGIVLSWKQTRIKLFLFYFCLCHEDDCAWMQETG